MERALASHGLAATDPAPPAWAVLDAETSPSPATWSLYR